MQDVFLKMNGSLSKIKDVTSDSNSFVVELRHSNLKQDMIYFAEKLLTTLVFVLTIIVAI